MEVKIIEWMNGKLMNWWMGNEWMIDRGKNC